MWSWIPGFAMTEFLVKPGEASETAGVVEERAGFAGALPSVGGFGGPVEVPQSGY